MATWFIRLGTVGASNHDVLQDFAFNHNLIQIGYGIEDDITDRNLKGIREHIQIKNPQVTDKRKISAQYEQIDKFINQAKQGDKVISPFGENNEKLRIGTIQGECNTIEAFFENKKNEYNALISKHSSAIGQDPIGIKPAREVKWESKEINLDEFSDKAKSEIGKPKRRTIYELDIEELINEIDIEELVKSPFFSSAEKDKLKDFFGDVKKGGIKFMKITAANVYNTVVSLLFGGFIGWLIS